MKDLLYQVYCKEQKKLIPVIIPYENDGLGEYVRAAMEECKYKPANGCRQAICPVEEIFKSAPDKIQIL